MNIKNKKLTVMQKTRICKACTVGYTGIYACGVSYQMQVVYDSLYAKADTRKQEFSQQGHICPCFE